MSKRKDRDVEIYEDERGRLIEFAPKKKITRQLCTLFPWLDDTKHSM